MSTHIDPTHMNVQMLQGINLTPPNTQNISHTNENEQPDTIHKEENTYLKMQEQVQFQKDKLRQLSHTNLNIYEIRNLLLLENNPSGQYNHTDSINSNNISKYFEIYI